MLRWGELIERLKRASGLPDHQQARQERRKAVRFARSFSLVGVRDSGEQVRLIVSNCAATGIYIESSTRLKKGENLALWTEETRHQTSQTLPPRAHVIWTRANKIKMTNEAGLAFIIDTADQRRRVSQFLLDEIKVGILNPKENRRAPRVEYRMSGRLGAAEGAFGCKVKDIAVGGALIVVDRALTRGTEAHISIDLPRESRPLECNGLVLRCLKNTRGEYEIAIGFTVVADNHKERLVQCLSSILERDKDARKVG